MKKLTILSLILIGVIFLFNCTLTKKKNEDTTTTTVAALTKYSISVASLSNGKITLDKSAASSGTIINLTISPATGYALKSGTLTVTKTGDEATIITLTAGSTAGNYNFTMPASNVKVSAEFQTAINYVGDDGKSGYGSVTVSGSLTANAGQTVALSVTPSGTSGLYHARLTYTAISGGTAIVINPATDGTYSFIMPTYYVTVNAVITNVYQIGDRGPSGWGKVVVSNTSDVADSGLEVVLPYWDLDKSNDYPLSKWESSVHTQVIANKIATLNVVGSEGGTATNWHCPSLTELKSAISASPVTGINFPVAQTYQVSDFYSQWHGCYEISRDYFYPNMGDYFFNLVPVRNF